MQKIFLVMCFFVFVGGVCFAKQSTTCKTASPAAASKTFTGKVTLISLGDAKKAATSDIAVVNDKGQEMSFAVKKGTPVFGKDGKSITLAAVVKGNKVIIKYTVGKIESITVIE
ncbi:MAG: hypothetical protein WCI77_07100 [Candidatus Omnitrophota bacterium]